MYNQRRIKCKADWKTISPLRRRTIALIRSAPMPDSYTTPRDYRSAHNWNTSLVIENSIIYESTEFSSSHTHLAGTYRANPKPRREGRWPSGRPLVRTSRGTSGWTIGTVQSSDGSVLQDVVTTMTRFARSERPNVESTTQYYVLITMKFQTCVKRYQMMNSQTNQYITKTTDVVRTLFKMNVKKNSQHPKYH